MPHRMLAALVFVAGCGNGIAPGGAPDASVAADLSMTALVDMSNGLVVARPYNFHVPTNYDKTQAAPLVILLHGYTASGMAQESYFKLIPVSDAHTFLYAYPDGTVDGQGNRFWNATDACCDFFKTNIDDVGYINAIIDDVEKKYTVDAKRIFVVGHSNGGFMSHRLACDSAPRVAAIVSLAGMTWKDMTRCQPGDNVAVLQVHGTSDMTVPYGGGFLGGQMALAIPSARESVAFWAAKDGCMATPDTSAPSLDLDFSLPGNETKVERWLGCKSGAVELWSIQGGMHVPSLRPIWGETIYGFLAAHPKP